MKLAFFSLKGKQCACAYTGRGGYLSEVSSTAWNLSHTYSLS